MIDGKIIILEFIMDIHDKLDGFYLAYKEAGDLNKRMTFDEWMREFASFENNNKKKEVKYGKED